MIRKLVIADSGEFVFEIHDHSGSPFFGQYAELLAGTVLSAGKDTVPAAGLRTDLSASSSREVIFVKPGGKLQVVMADDGLGLELIVSPDRLADDSARMKIWQSLTVCAGVGAVLQGIPMVLMHGAVLLDRDGKAILLCADSGVGKSTTSRRWQELGGDFAADDMFLLEYNQRIGGFFAYALPTWSRCRIAPEPVRVPADRPLPVVGILGLSRSAQGDMIEEVSRIDFWGQILRSACCHTKSVVDFLAPELQQQFSRSISGLVGAAVDTFPACGLFANLHGDLAAAIKDYREKFLKAASAE